jgi:hypothetical protein
MALECGCISRNCAYRDDGLRVFLHQNADLLLQPLNGYADVGSVRTLPDNLLFRR